MAGKLRIKGSDLIVTSQLNRQNWQLFDMPGVGAAVKELNKALGQSLKASNVDEAYKIIGPVTRKFVEFGACDSEPWYLISKYFEFKFGEC